MSLVSHRSAFDLHRHSGTSMRKVSEYELNAQECLKLATMISDPDHKTALLHMADTWIMLAHGRKKRLSQDSSNNDDATDEE
jgi:hypothetical protein